MIVWTLTDPATAGQLEVARMLVVLLGAHLAGDCMRGIRATLRARRARRPLLVRHGAART